MITIEASAVRWSYNFTISRLERCWIFQNGNTHNKGTEFPQGVESAAALFKADVKPSSSVGCQQPSPWSYGDFNHVTQDGSLPSYIQYVTVCQTRTINTLELIWTHIDTLIDSMTNNTSVVYM